MGWWRGAQVKTSRLSRIIWEILEYLIVGPRVGSRGPGFPTCEEGFHCFQIDRPSPLPLTLHQPSITPFGGVLRLVTMRTSYTLLLSLCVSLQNYYSYFMFCLIYTQIKPSMTGTNS